MQKITVNTGKQYDILLGAGLRNGVADLVLPFCPNKKILIITDDIVDGLFADELAKALISGGFYAEKFVFKNGESSKNINTLSAILEFAALKGFKRNDLFLALGGGVPGDIAGLASSLYMRGVPVVQMPTTLLSAVDSSVGGKTAIDLKAGKNLCGTFKQPELVIIDTDIIKNLPEDIFVCGLGEVIKCSIIKELPVFDLISKNAVRDNIEKIIFDCLTLKKDIVERDEFDTKGIRNLLNVGHTVGHAIELLSDFSIMHGNAVAMGTVVEAKISHRLGLCDSVTAEVIEKAVNESGLYFEIPFSKDDIANACLIDKKNKDSRIVFLLPEKIGSCREVKLTIDELTKLL